MYPLALVVFLPVLISAAVTPIVMSIIVVPFQFPWPFSRVFSRVAQITILVLVLLLRKRFGLSHYVAGLRRQTNGSRITDFMAGFVTTAATVAIVLPCLVRAGVLEW